tara:strand:- start:562 stop:3576 length:3015 start_codon:yes stop_codon:yes gene_type:complete
MRNLLLFFSFLLVIIHADAQENFPVNGVVSKYKTVHALINAEIHVDAETSISRAVLLISEDKIIGVGNALDIPENAIIHNLEGAHVYPSFIDPYTNYGLPKVKKQEWSPRPQIKSKTVGPFSWNEALKPEFDAAASFSPSQTSGKSLRNAGFGTVLSFQNDGIVRGSSCIVSLGKGSAQKELLKPRAMSHYAFSKGSSKQSYPNSFMGAIALLRQSIYDAIWAHHNRDQRNISLTALHNNLKLKPVIEVDNHNAIRNVLDLSKEFKMNFIIKGSGDEYLSLDGLGEAQFIIPVNFPDAYDVSDPYESLSLSLEKMKHWELAPANAALLASKGVEFAFTTFGLSNTEDFLDKIKSCIKHGLDEETALKALTSVPAKMLGISDSYGSLKKGMKANFIVCEKNLFHSENKILENWIQGQVFVVSPRQEHDYRGSYILKINGDIFPLEIKGDKESLDAVLISKDTTKMSFTVENELIKISYKDNTGGLVRLSGHGKDPIEGQGQLSNGSWVSFLIKRKKKFEREQEKVEQNNAFINADPIQVLNDMGERWFPNVAYGWLEKPEQKAVLFKNVTLWTNEKEGVVENSSIAIVDGKIVAVGNDAVKEIKDKYDFEIVDGVGKHLSSGIIDEHSHIALRSVNESSQSSSAEVRMSDAIRPNDINIYRQLAGGVTIAQLLHGSANPIGGQSALIKMRWGSDVEGLLYDNAKPFVKFALGENVKQSNWGDYSRVRFPQTRMGVEQVYYDAFIRAKEYDKDWVTWRKLSSSQKKESKMPRKDLDLDCLLEILKDEREITCHSYRQSEINMLMHVADSMGFTLNTFTHILEGYKVAEKMKAHGAGASTFSDWWAYKYEVNDAIPHNGTLLNDMGIVTAFNSDDAEMARRLNQEAAKAVKYGGASEEDAWKFITLNPAKLLHIEDKTGSLKKGKDADLVLWSGHPMSVYSVVEQTYVDGRLYYSLSLDMENRLRNAKERNRLTQKMLSVKRTGKKTQKIKKERSFIFHCDDESNSF